MGGSIVGICAYIVEELVGGGCSLLGYCSLFGTNFSEGDEEFVIDGASVLEDISYDSLDTFYANFVKGMVWEWVLWII